MISRKTFKNISYKLILLSLLIVFWLWQNRAASFSGTSVNYLDIGQGDAVYILTDSGQDILIDGGPDQALAGVLPKVMNSGDHYIDMVILTHPHADHVSGLLWVLEHYQIGEILLIQVDYQSQVYKKFLELIKEKSIKTAMVDGFHRYNFDQDTYLEILGPSQNHIEQVHSDVNHTSISSKFVDGKNKFFFGGDIEKEDEDELIEIYGHKLEADVMMAPHHGSHTSSTLELIQAVSPQYTVISSGQGNKYGHPHRDVLDRYMKLNIPILRTDQKGTITILSNGLNLSVK